MLLGHARGKVGSLVFSRANGKQVVRSRAEVVKNPRSEEQMIQRIILNTTAQGYSNMKQIVDHSFEGLSVGQASMSFFMQRNMDNIRTLVAQQKAQGALLSEIYEFSPLKSNYLAAQEFLIAKGTLPAIDIVQTNADASLAISLKANTYAAIIEDYGLQRGDQLTFVGVIQVGTRKRAFEFVRVILDPRDSEGNELPLTTAFVGTNAVNKPSDRNEGAFTSLSWGANKLSFGFSSDILVCAAVIVSRKDNNGNWLRSNATLTRNEAGASDVYDMQTCLNLLSDTSIAGLSSLYLNNAGTGNVNAGGTSGDSGDDDGPSGEP